MAAFLRQLHALSFSSVVSDPKHSFDIFTRHVFKETTERTSEEVWTRLGIREESWRDTSTIKHWFLIVFHPGTDRVGVRGQRSRPSVMLCCFSVTVTLLWELFFWHWVCNIFLVYFKSVTCQTEVGPSFEIISAFHCFCFTHFVAFVDHLHLFLVDLHF